MAHMAPHNGGWRVQVRKDGVRRSKVFKTKAEAKLWASKLELEIESGKAETGHTFEQAVNRYLKEVSPKKDGHRWEVLRLRAFLQFEEFDRRLSKIDQTHIASWRNKRLESVKDSTLLRELNLLRNVFTVARNEWRWMENNPIVGVKMPEDEPPREAVWGWRDIKKVLRAKTGTAPKTDEVIDAFHIAIRTGMRLSEVLRAPQGLDPKRRIVTLHKTKTTKAGRVVEVPVGRIATRLLQRPAFSVGANEASTLFARLTKQLGIVGLTFHDTRATALTHLSKKIEVLDLAKVSRHKNINQLSKTYYRPKLETISARI